MLNTLLLFSSSFLLTVIIYTNLEREKMLIFFNIGHNNPNLRWEHGNLDLAPHLEFVFKIADVVHDGGKIANGNDKVFML